MSILHVIFGGVLLCFLVCCISQCIKAVCQCCHIRQTSSNAYVDLPSPSAPPLDVDRGPPPPYPTNYGSTGYAAPQASFQSGYANQPVVTNVYNGSRSYGSAGFVNGLIVGEMLERNHERGDQHRSGVAFVVSSADCK